MSKISYLNFLFPTVFKKRIKNALGVPSLHWSLQNLKEMGFIPRNIIDIGAYEGEWTIEFLTIFPQTKVLMVEAQNSKVNMLNKICDKYPNISLKNCLLFSDKNISVIFRENETNSHIALDFIDDDKIILSESLDNLIETLDFPQPNFIKLDVQGAEIDVLKGANKTLLNCEFCLLEVTLIKISNTPLFIEVLDYMDSVGFQVYDICNFMRRPFDQALYQMDVLFINKTSSFIAKKRWN